MPVTAGRVLRIMSGVFRLHLPCCILLRQIRIRRIKEMTIKEIGRRISGTNYCHLNYTLSEFKNVAPIIDADGLQLARHSRGRPAVFTEILIA